ncbi:MAG: Mth938-like domain-containing protein [Rhodospirillales bacterium]|nr:Mth938-like domain-containing protein [Rhodospirillales bacterium]
MADSEPRATAAGVPQVIQSYGGGGFRVAGQRHEGSLILYPRRAEPWPVAAGSDISLESLKGLLARDNTAAMLLVGCGPRFLAPPKDIAAAVRASGAGLEWMTTAAACRTWNLLLVDERAVIAALIAVE